MDIPFINERIYRHLIAGYCSLGQEILHDVPDVDIVVVIKQNFKNLLAFIYYSCYIILRFAVEVEVYWPEFLLLWRIFQRRLVRGPSISYVVRIWPFGRVRSR